MAIASPAAARDGALITVPGQQGQATVVTFTLMRRSASYRSEVGLFRVNDARGRIDTLRPGDRGYAVAALGRHMIVFDRGQKRGAIRQIVLPVGSVFGTYLVANSISDRVLRGTPAIGPADRRSPIFPSGRPTPTAIRTSSAGPPRASCGWRTSGAEATATTTTW